MTALSLSRRKLLIASLGALASPAVLRAGEAGGQREVPWLDEVQRVPASLPADAPRLAPLLVDAENRPIADVAGWQRKREAIRRAWLEFLKPLPVERKGPPALEVLEEDRPEGAVRQLVRYEVEPGVPVEAYLLRPPASQDARPGAVVFHPTVTASIREPAGIEGRPNMALGLNLARRGWVAFCPRNFLWRNNRSLDIRSELPRFRQRHPTATGMAKMLFDAITAVDILASLPGVDPKRLAAVGHSLGAKEVLYLAAFDQRIQVSVSSEGGIGTKFSNWEDPWYLGDAIRKPEFTREHHELLALVAPRAFLLLGGESADGEKSWPFIGAVLPVYRLYGGPARVGLFNHKKGHSVPPEAEGRMYEWFETYG